MDTFLTPSRVSEEVEDHNLEDSAPGLFYSPSIVSREWKVTILRTLLRIFEGKDRLEQIPDIISPPVGVISMYHPRPVVDLFGESGDELSLEPVDNAVPVHSGLLPKAPEETNNSVTLKIYCM